PGRTGIKDEGLLAALAPPRFRVIKNESTTIKLIQRELAKHHILHFTGHGTFEKGKRKESPAAGVSSPTVREGITAQPEAPVDAQATDTVSTPKPLPLNKRATWLVMEDSDGNAEKVEDASIVQNLIQRGDNQLPRLIFLSSCDTSRYDERQPRAFNSL